MIRADSYDEVIDYLLRYAADDWLMLSTVVDLAEGVAGDGSTTRDVADTSMRLAAALTNGGCPPGDLMDDDRDFVPWSGSDEERLARLRAELDEYVARDELPLATEICWFHTITD